MIDFCITTLDRYPLLDELLESIFKYYPEAQVTVADQSKNFSMDVYEKHSKGHKIDLYKLEYDCGLSKARNTLVENTYNPYILLLEDDFLFTEDTKVDKLLSLMEVADIAGGGVYKKDYRIPFEFYLEKHGNTLKQLSDGDNWQEHNGVTYKNTGCVLNFALFKRTVFDDLMWKEELKIREHQHFFYRARLKDIGVAFTDDAKILDNKKGNTPEYKRLKGRDEYWKIAMDDLGITRVEYLSGQVVELEGDKVYRS